MFTWNPNPRRSTRLSLVCLLLPPRSVLVNAPANLTVNLRHNHYIPPTCRSFMDLRRVPFCGITATAKNQCNAWAPSIFRAERFGRWVVTHSLADADFHGHRPTVYNEQHLLWGLICVYVLGTLSQRMVHPTSPVLLTKNGPLSTMIDILLYTCNEHVAIKALKPIGQFE